MIDDDDSLFTYEYINNKLDALTGKTCKTKSFQMLPSEFFSTYAALKYINLSHSKLFKIADYTFGLPYLQELNLSGNELISLSANVFSGAANLLKIDLSHNMISIIEPETFTNLRSLLDLNLSYNQINNNSFNRDGIDWTDDIESLRTLDLSSNQLFYYDVMPYQAFSGLVNLEKLTLRSNRITIDYGSFSSNQMLRVLDLSYNGMTYFDLNFLLSIPNLATLLVHGNEISYVSQLELSDVRTEFPSMKSLGISENTFSCEVLSVIIKKMMKANINLVVEEGKFVNNQRNLRGVACS